MVRRTLLAIGMLGALHVHGEAMAVEIQTPKELAARIDHWIAAKWHDNAVKPAAPTDDAEFVRRVYLDLAGRIPRVSEVRDFLADTAPDKRERLCERLLDSARYVQHFTNTWTDILLPATNDPNLRFLTTGFRAWVEKQVRENSPYDQTVRDLLTVGVPTAPVGREVARAPANVSPAAFYQANEQKPENLAASTSRLFLGIQVECAQCHDHPFSSWKRTQFWEFAAFFSGVQVGQRAVVPNPPGPQTTPAGRSIKIPETDKVALARYLTGEEPRWEANVDARITLANWVTARDNPYFARTAANRIWAHFFGLGLSDPVDEEATADNPISHPELLQELSEQFVAHNFDVKFLIRAITLSKSYQLSSEQTDASQDSPRLFARMAIRGLTPEQLYDSLAMATGYRDPTPPAQQQFAAFNGNTPRGEFLARFDSRDKRTEKQTSILQALALMNGKFIADATSIERSTTLATIAEVPFMDTAERIETLFLATLSRLPRTTERERFVAYVARGGVSGDERKALADVFWTLLNSSEFILNH